MNVNRSSRSKRNNRARTSAERLTGSGRYSIHLVVLGRRPPPPSSYHLHRHLRETETTEDERVAFYASKSDEETRGPTKCGESTGTEGTRSGVVGGTPRVIELPGRSGVAQVR